MPNPLKVSGVGRMWDNEKALLLILDRKPTDDELRAIHNQLSGETAEVVAEAANVLQAVCEGYGGTFAEGYIIVENPEATAEALALRGVNPNLVIDCRKLLAVLKP